MSLPSIEEMVAEIMARPDKSPIDTAFKEMLRRRAERELQMLIDAYTAPLPDHIVDGKPIYLTKPHGTTNGDK